MSFRMDSHKSILLVHLFLTNILLVHVVNYLYSSGRLHTCSIGMFKTEDMFAKFSEHMLTILQLSYREEVNGTT